MNSRKAIWSFCDGGCWILAFLAWTLSRAILLVGREATTRSSIRIVSEVEKDKRRAQFGTRPWLQDAPEELEAFGEWLQTRHNGHRICQDVLVMDSAEPITMSKRVIDHLVRTGTFEEYGP